MIFSQNEAHFRVDARRLVNEVPTQFMLISERPLRGEIAEKNVVGLQRILLSCLLTLLTQLPLRLCRPKLLPANYEPLPRSPRTACVVEVTIF